MNSKGSPLWPTRENHPPAEVLFLSLEGELPAAERMRVESHLTVCWECQTQIETWHEATRALVQYRRHAQAELIPGPPAGWSGFRGTLRRAAQEAGPGAPPRRTFRQMLADFIRQSRGRLAFAATSLTALAVFLYIGPGPTLSATELLTRAVSEERPAAQKLRIRVRSHEYTRDIGNEDSVASDARMRVLFESAQLDWDRPLSAKDFQRWRNGLTHKTDRISEKNAAWILETVSEEGPVLAAELTVRASDFHPIHGTLRFAGDEEVEITELASEVARTEAPVAATRLTVEKPTLPATLVVKDLPPPTQPAVIAAAVDLERIEMDVRIALFQAGVDVSDEIQILHASDKVIVEGLVETAVEKAAVVAALAPLSNVQARIRYAGESVAPQTPAPSFPTIIDSPGSTHAALLESELEKQFPKREERSAFVRQTIASSRAALVHSWALRRLAERYPDTKAVALDKEAYAKLRTLVASHAAAVRREIDQTASNLAPWIGSFSNTDSNAGNSPWQSSVLDVFSYVRRMDADVTILLSKTSSNKTADEVTQDLQRASSFSGRLTELQKQLENQ